MDFPSIALLLIIIILVGTFAYLENKGGLPGLSGNNTDGGEADGDNSPLKKIFLNYQHKSYQEWLSWVLLQPANIQDAAAKKIIKHLEDHPKHWGFLTLEAVECLRGFKNNEEVYNALCEFFKNCSKLWGEYKSIPNYYKKAADVMTELNMDKTMIIFLEDLDRKGQAQQIQDKKKILIDILPKHGANAVIPLSKVITDSGEAIATRSYALRKIKKFDKDHVKDILLRIITEYNSKYNSVTKSLKADDSQLLQDTLKDAAKYVGQGAFFAEIRKACENPILKSVTLNILIAYIESKKEDPTKLELIALAKMEDNSNSDLRRALSKLAGLDTTEIEKITTQKIKKDFSRSSIIDDEPNCSYPIPAILEEKFNEFSELFYSSDSKRYTACDKSTGGVLITGNNLLEKIYFAKALADDKAWNFGFVDIEDITNKESFNEVSSIFSRLRKPYLLYISNPNLLYDQSEDECGLFRAKFAQTLYVQALDAKSFIVGDIEKPNAGLGDEDKLAISKLRNKFLAQETEISNEEQNHYSLVEEHMKFISSSRLSNITEICNDLAESGKVYDSIEFIFYTVDMLAKMLLVFGTDVKASEIEKLEARLVNNSEDEGSVSVLLEDDSEINENFGEELADAEEASEAQ